MSFEIFYEQSVKKIFLYAVRRVGSKEIAEDITADAFLRVFKNWSKINGRTENEMLAFAFTVCRNLIIDFYRRKKPEPLDHEPIDDNDELLKDLIKEDNKKMIHEALKLLAQEKQELLELRYARELSFKEISGVTGKKEAACKMMLYRALQELKLNLLKLEADKTNG